MKVLLVGSGGREHTLAWKIAQDTTKPEIFCAPGNAGTASLGTNLPLSATDLEGLLNWAQENKPDLTVVGPEAPLCAGLVDLLTDAGFRAFGPMQAAAQLEGSKVFAKEVMQAGNVPTPRAHLFSDTESAMAYAHELGTPLVVKADGLAAGKGVTVCTSIEQAEAAIREAIETKAFGEAGHQILLEECAVGEEASILALVDGTHITLLASSQDHKRALEGDQGPNTGGMGAYSPAPVVTKEMWPLIREQVFERTLAELNKRGILFKGIMYAGLMITESGPTVLEFNCRFGDPETQVILPRWEGDILPAFEACIDGTLDECRIKWKPEACACVVMASGGYPGAYDKGHVIEGLEEADKLDDVVVFHAGTGLSDGNIITTGGRVLGVTGLGKDLQKALSKAYEAVSLIDFEAAQYRKDIGWRALKGNR